MENEIRYEPIDDEAIYGSEFGGDDWVGEALQEMGLEEEAEDDRKVVRVHPLEVVFEYVRTLVPGTEIDDRGLELPDGASWDDVENLSEMFHRMAVSSPILWADILNQAELRFRSEWTQLLGDYIGRAEGTVRNWRYVANQIPWAMRPDLRRVQMSKLYHIAGLMAYSSKRTLIAMADLEGLDTGQVQALCDLLKLYEDDGLETHTTDRIRTEGLDYQEASFMVRQDLIARGILEDETQEEEAEEDPKEKGAQTAEALVDKIMKLAEQSGEDVPRNVLALFASLVQQAKILSFSNSPEEVEAIYAVMGMTAQHLLDLRIAQIEAGTSDVGCTCEFSDMANLAQLVDCPVHGEAQEAG